MPLLYSDKFLKHLTSERRASHHTANAYMRDLEIFRSFMKEHKGKELDHDTLKELSESDLHSFITHGVMNENVSKQTVNRRLSAVKTYFKWLKRKSILRNDSVLTVKGVKASKAPPKSISAHDVLEILKKLRPPKEGADMAEKRDYALILTLYGLGVRISEALEMNVSDAHAERIVVMGKGGKERSLPVPKPVRMAMTDLYESVPHNNPDDPLFINQRLGQRLTARAAQLITKKVRQDLGLPDHLTPHTLRHCYATHLLQNGADIRTLQELLGHSSLAATERYLATNAKELKKTHNKSHPLNKG